jgi:Flp pilus assembly protein TadD
LTFQPAASVPPTSRQLAVFLKEYGVEKTLALAPKTASRPNPTDRLASAAACLLRDGEAAAALPALSYAVKQDPKSTILHIWLGQALALTGDRVSALTAYRKAAELHPGDQTMGNSGAAYKYMIDKGLKELGSSEQPPNGR